MSLPLSKDAIKALNVAISAADVLPTCKKVCKGCPFRKGSQWVPEEHFDENIFRLLLGVVQHCHMTVKSGNYQACLGNVIALDGGNDEVYSAREFIKLDPCPDDDAQSRYAERF